ncbi:PI-PLC X domain-containing protein 1 [Otolemur garnettii]|uniref:PI-PLC X domain-containing protein 1 n=1 Tax=Otolemur garnettii TaxID=30611 RepID=UPI000C7EF732|nr:PI-PLC X domain-containing protein 1 [Otolemur garnettii]
MASPKIEAVIRQRHQMAECPVWEEETGQLVYVDINGRSVCRWSPFTGEVQTVGLRNRVGCVGLCQKGTYVVAAGTCLGLLDWGTQQVQWMAWLDRDKPHNRFNDGKVDPAGRFVAANPRILYHLQQGQGMPDGMCVDTAGKLWVACIDGGRVIRVDPETGRAAAGAAGKSEEQEVAGGCPATGGQMSTDCSFRSLRCRMGNSDWMSALSPQLWDVPLHHLSIPGSHDTMTYCLNKKSPISQAQPRLLQLLSRAAPCITLPVVLKWSITQVGEVRGPLGIGGGRGLPLPGLCSLIPPLTLTLGKWKACLREELPGLPPASVGVCKLLSMSPSQDTLTEISEWLEKHPQEVVILACRNFEGMTEDLHEYLVTCIKNIFGDMLCPRGEVPTLRQLWSHGQQVLLSYEDESSVGRHLELWPGIPYWWGDKVKTEALICYLESMKNCGRPGGLFVAGINLTENLPYILAHPSGSLKKMTLPSLPRLGTWVREQCPGPGPHCTNIIAGDFIGADGFVSDVIRLNEKLLRC